MSSATAPNEAEFPELHHFLSGYFHEDWIDDVTSPTQAFDGSLEPEDQWYKRVVERYVRLSGQVRAAQTVTEIHALLERRLPEPQLAHFVGRNLSCSYYPGENVPFSAWLVSVADHLVYCTERAA